MHPHTCEHVHIWNYTHINMHTQTHIYMYAYVHTNGAEMQPSSYPWRLCNMSLQCVNLFQITGHCQDKAGRDSKALLVGWCGLLQWVWSAPLFNDPQEPLTQGLIILSYVARELSMPWTKPSWKGAFHSQALGSLKECLSDGDLGWGL